MSDPVLPLKQVKQIEYKSVQEVRRALGQVSLYVCFLIATTKISLSTQHVHIFYFNQAIEQTFFAERKEDTVSFRKIVTIDDWWNWIEHKFLKELSYSINPKDENKTKKLKPEEVADIHSGVTELLIFDNYYLGVPRLRQIRVKEGSCAVNEYFRKYFNSCYGEYSYSNEETVPEYKGTRYYSRREYEATPIIGNLNRYNGPGYMVTLGYATTENFQTVNELIKNQWIDEATRMVVLEFVVYNVNTHLFNNVKIMAEVLPTGGVIPKWDFQMVPLSTIWSPRSLSTLFAAIVFYLLVVYYTSVEIREVLNDGLKKYFGNVNNYADITILLTAEIALTMSTFHPFQMDKYLGSITTDPNSLASLDEPCFWFFIYIYVMAVCVFMVWAKIFRYVGFNKTLLQFSTTLSRCFSDIMGFAVMFIIVFFAFALFGYLVFGEQNPNFTTFVGSIFSMVRMVLGDFPYERIEAADRILGPIFCIVYVVLITFIILNMFLAIINETYGAVKHEITEGYSAIKVFIVNIIEKCKKLFLHYTQRVPESRIRELGRSTSIYKNRDDTGSLLDYSEISLSGTPKKRKRNTTTSQTFSEEEPDDNSVELLRLSQRLDLIDELLQNLTDNINRIVRRKRHGNR